MRVDARSIAAALAFGAAAASIAYTGFAVIRLVGFGRRVRAHRRRTRFGRDSVPLSISPRPSITILKPVRGLERELEPNLRSFCVQDYPAFDVVLGVRDPDDLAVPVLRRLAAEFPGRVTAVAGDGTARCRNPKIATLLPMIEHATGDVLVIADSDMRVTPDYLDAVAAAFMDPRAGAGTAIYRGEPADFDLASALGAMWITEQFAPSVLVATALESLTYCFGSTMAVRRTVLDTMGGLAPLGDHLADDHRLGMLVTALGHTVALMPYVVENVVAEDGLRGLVEHEVRWARTIRGVRPASYPGILLTYPVPLALAAFALARRKRRSRVLLTIAMVARLCLHAAAHASLGTRAWRRTPPRLVHLRDVLGVTVWALGLCGRSVHWRADALSVARDGKLAG
ncbi:MAG TPA: bacteriohopanetetrol glucosamine biosynthesis glycosyltransferase HpnI [Candidatus Elarobacter sp.]|nr:bacteriohopanetetrol glucosamine biosynthesis glycosyltransferase HpnI [Candidatus Elarobacter sp.]